jgi:NAD(P)-dependent dehydrogenase (short-subunit alcohol dehydrogenase family)
MASQAFYTLVAGVGPGTGRAVAARFAKAYPVVLLARSQSSYESTLDEIKAAGGKAIAISTDVSDPSSLKAAIDGIEKELPGHKLAAAVYNISAAPGFKPFLELDADSFNTSLDANVKAFFGFSQAVLPLLEDSVSSSSHAPSLIVTGATASSRGSAKFGGFAAGKFALRGLSQSLAREFGPKGVHVAHVIVDGVIDIPRTKHYDVNNGAPDGKISPEAIADTYWFLHTQHRSAFTQELDIRPYIEKF